MSMSTPDQNRLPQIPVDSEADYEHFGMKTFQKNKKLTDSGSKAKRFRPPLCLGVLCG
jgi:hypothetical protein